MDNRTILTSDQIVNILKQQQEMLNKMQLELQNKDKIINSLQEKISENA